jgi:hypothetical protein
MSERLDSRIESVRRLVALLTDAIGAIPAGIHRRRESLAVATVLAAVGYSWTISLALR